MNRELIDTELDLAWEELKQKGISQNDYTAGVHNVKTLVDIREQTSRLEFEEENRELRETREWYNAQTKRIEAEAKCKDSETRLEVAKLDSETRLKIAQMESEARLEAARLDSEAKLADSKARMEAAELDWEARIRDSEAKVKAAQYECGTKVVTTAGSILMTFILASFVATMDQEGVFPTKWISIITGVGRKA